jgi:hypothetical protein
VLRGVCRCVCCASSPVALWSARLLQQHSWTSCLPLANSSTHALPAAEMAAASRQPACNGQHLALSTLNVSNACRFTGGRCWAMVLGSLQAQHMPTPNSPGSCMRCCKKAGHSADLPHAAVLLHRAAELRTCRVPRQHHRRTLCCDCCWGGSCSQRCHWWRQLHSAQYAAAGCECRCAATSWQGYPYAAPAVVAAAVAVGCCGLLAHSCEGLKHRTLQD